MSQLRVSTEIITLIISYLAYEKRTLHSLLTVNKVWYNATIPILYKNPFRPCFWDSTSEVKKREVLYLLLASSNLPPKLARSLREFLNQTLTEWDPPTAPFTVNYLDYYTEINYLEWEHSRSEKYSYVTRKLNHKDDRTINLLLCEHNAKKLKSVCLPILGMKSYLPLATRMSSLKQLKYCRIDKDQTLITYDQDIAIVRDAIEFVKAHVETFDGILAEIKLPDLSDLKCDRNQLDVQIWDIIKLLKRPSLIEVDASYNFCRYIQGPTVEHLRVFSAPLMRDEVKKPHWDSDSLIQRCPKLEKICFCPSRSNSFKWAVEKRDLLVDSGSSLSSTPDIKLPPLREVYAKCQKISALLIVQDIIYAFPNTIRVISVEETFFRNPYLAPLSWDWLLPNLVKIQIHFVDFTLFNLESLNFCPSLKELGLISHSRERGSSPEFGPVLRLPNLRKISLLNGICYKFNFASLKNSPLLETGFFFENGSSSPIRPSDPPCWTWNWDWKLPHLKNLTLIGESATLFQFRLLDSCPRLEQLSLNIGEYHRTLTLNEILNTDVSTECVSHVVPVHKISCKYKEFRLTGFKISGETLSALLQRYMLHVTEIHLDKLVGLTSTDIINVTQKLPHIRYVHSTLTLTNADIDQNKMYLAESKKYGEVWRCGFVNYMMR
ncbi:hypothetical protein K7432_006127 [Basidiobolus ranarum]|uniref:F-box domain-containing protein n=1 Tax=Basidiobolus ranarum TaxID=34480 RepID=A0ABR2W240_9FUNG